MLEQKDKAYALRVTGLDQPRMLEQWWDMARAKSLTEFQTTLRRMQLPVFTVIYADREGYIMHFFGGLNPVRPNGTWDWKGMVPGETSATLWTKTHSFDELPLALDPTSGWLQNSNDPPWTTTFPPVLKAEDYPGYLSPQKMSLRAQRSVRMLLEDDSISFEEMIRYKHSTHVELADRILKDLISAARRQGAVLATQAADVLEKWDRNANAGSRGALLFAVFFAEMKLGKRHGSCDPFKQCWDENEPLGTPNGLVDPEIAVQTLERAARGMIRNYGGLDVSWGEVCRLRNEGVDLAGNGAPGMGVFRSVFYMPILDGYFQAAGGDSFVAAIEFSNPVRAMALMSYGNSSQPGSVHGSDQLKLFAQKELRAVWRSREEIEAHLSRREVL